MQEAAKNKNARLLRLGIVTPSFNQAGFIRQTIESVLTQDYPEFEYWVMDGGSTDGTLAILKEYEQRKNSRFHWFSGKDAGQSDAINKGWARCTGEILAWINSDDYYLPGAFRAAADGFARSPETGLLFGPIREVDEHDRPIAPRVGYRHSSAEEMLSHLELPYQPSTFFRREMLDRVGWLDASWHYVLDSDLILRSLANFPAQFHAEVLAAFRLHPKSKTRTKEGDFGEELLRLAEYVLAHRDRYPRLAHVSEQQLRSTFLRRAAKHFNLAGRFTRASALLLAAAKCNPACVVELTLHDFPRLVARRIMPFWLYNRCGLKLRE